MAKPQKLVDVAELFGVSRSTMWNLVTKLGLQKYRLPGQGKTTYLDPDEVRRKWKAKPVEKKSTEGDG